VSSSPTSVPAEPPLAVGIVSQGTEPGAVHTLILTHFQVSLLLLFQGKFTLLRDSRTDGSFLVHHFLSFYLRAGCKVCFLALVQSFSHYNIVAQKLVSLPAQVGNCRPGRQAQTGGCSFSSALGRKVLWYLCPGTFRRMPVCCFWPLGKDKDLSHLRSHKHQFLSRGKSGKDYMYHKMRTLRTKEARPFPVPEHPSHLWIEMHLSAFVECSLTAMECSGCGIQVTSQS
uniref:Uncharacterized protein n=1 Tax=Chrysolophus pictus TaxID=9089 RepID=A0A8C3M228_CHRPC